MPALRTISARTIALVLALAAAPVPIAGPAQAQTPAPEAVSVSLIGQPVWHDEDDPLDLQLRITNEGLSTLEGFRLQVGAYPAATSRSALHSNFDISPLSVEISSLSVDESATSIAPGTSAVVSIENPVSDLTSLSGAGQGVYPLTITITAPDGFTALDSVTTQLIYLPEVVEVPLNVVPIWPLVDLPSRASGGVFTPAAEGEPTGTETASSPGGWLTGILDALEARSSERLKLGVAPGGRLADELADMSDGFRRAGQDRTVPVPETDPAAQAAGETLDRVRALAQDPDIQMVIGPYAYADLTSIDDFEQVSAQLTATASVFSDVLETSPERGWLLPPAGRLDEVTLERIRSTDAAASTFFSADSLEPEAEGGPACRQDFTGITYTCPVKVTTSAGKSRGYVLDAELQQRFGALVSNPRSIVELQKLFAEIAMIWLELPGTSERVLAIAVPPLWHPPPAIAARFVRTMATGPWIRTRTPRGGLHLGVGAVGRDLISIAPPSHTQPDAVTLAPIMAAGDVVDSFARVSPPISLIQRLSRDVLMAQSALWWPDEERLSRGISYATGARREAETEMDKISIGGRRDITLTSRKGPVPLSLQNGTDYDVTLEILFESADRDLEISDRTMSQTFAPGATALPVQASARASGIYPVRVRIVSSDGYEIFETSIRIRSTEFNEIALVITVGALVFLVSFSAIRTVRRRRAEGETEQ